MSAYILGTGNISPQPTWGVDFIGKPVSTSGNQLKCIEPDYVQWIDLKQLRRMSRVMRMGAAAALLALRNANVKNPDAIITGTGLGCIEDTGTFLSRIINNKEDALNPTPFIQSTHNTIGSHLALLLQCQAYNQTYSHGSFSFEDGLQDALLQLSEFPDQNILVGGTDEVTDVSHNIQNRFGIFKKGNESSLDIFKSKTKGTLHGEGSAWFVLSGHPENEKIKVEGVKTIYRTEKPISQYIVEFLSSCKTSCDKIDLLITGKSGDSNSDAVIDKFLSTIFRSISTAVYKNLCGEYHTSTAFALWLAHSILKTGKIPAEIIDQDSDRDIKTILIYNPYFKEHHSLILLSSE